MNIRILSLLLFTLLYLVLPHQSIAQKKGDLEDVLYRAEKLFEIKNYKAALPLFIQSESLVKGNPLLEYKLGASYAQSPEINEQLKGIKYLESAIKVNSSQVPIEKYYYLGKLYHKDDRIAEAITSYNKYKIAVAGNKKALQEVDEELKICQNAKVLMSKKKEINITNLGNPINSEFTEYNPVVAADESVMAFTVLRPNKDKLKSGVDFVEEIMITYKSASGTWGAPAPIKIKSNYNAGTAGISPDGQKMLVFLGGAGNKGDLFTIDKQGSDWGAPVSIGNTINSPYQESTASITPDGKVVYFASNRNGGYGGMDIYKVIKNEKGVFGPAINLGPTVNTAKNEDAPFIHPDQKTLFFTSDGHNTMGGKDIFKSVLINDKWAAPENMGYPINTPANDNYFTLTANGRKGYFSSDRKGGNGGQDIYGIDMPDEGANIALTMIKGKILDGETLLPIPTKIKVVEKGTGEKIEYVYSPNKETGNYLIIFPPGKSYDLVIESEGFMPYTININIPDQTYFYELFQQIHLKQIKQFDVIVGQEVSVKNAFFDTKIGGYINPKKANEAMLVKNDSLDMFEMMDAIIASSDTIAFEYLLDLMFKSNPIENINFNENEMKDLEAAKRVYYYDESDEKTLEAKKVGKETIFTLPTMYVTELAKAQKEKKQEVANYDRSLLTALVKIYFDTDKSDLKADYNADLAKIMDALKKHENLGIEISGYASAEGDPEHNRKLSNLRAIEVLNYFNYKGVVRRRIVAKGYGASKAEGGNKQEGRRVEIRLLDLNAI